jgi:hypothetical protein
MEYVECQSCEADITNDDKVTTELGDIFCSECYEEFEKELSLNKDKEIN